MRASGAKTVLLTILGTISAALVVLTPTAAVAAPPANDDFANREVITDVPSQTPGDNTEATAESGEPNGLENSIWYEWTAPTGPDAIGTIAISTAGSTFNTLLYVYTGSGTDITDLTLDTMNDNAPGVPDSTSRVVFAPTEGTTYYIAVAGLNSSDTGVSSLNLDAIPAPANDMFADREVLTGFPTVDTYNNGATSEPDEPIHDTWPTPLQASIWYEWTAPAGVGTVTLSTADSDIDTVLALYTASGGTDITDLTELRFNDDDPDAAVPTLTSKIEFDPTPGTTYYIAVAGYDSSEQGFVRLALTEALPPANDDIADRTVLSDPLPLTTDGTNVGASREPGEPHHQGTADGASVWYEWTAPVSPDEVGAVTVSIDSSDFDTLLLVYRGDPSQFSSLRQLNPVGMSSPFLGPEVAFVPTPGQTYYIAVDGEEHGVTTGEFTLSLSVASGVAGTVRSAASGDPIRNICVQVIPSDASPGGGFTDTAGDGTYFVPVPPGEYDVLFVDCSAEYENQWYWAVADPGGPDIPADATEIQVQADQVTSGIDADMVRVNTTGSISGRVVDEAGDPIPNVMVTAWLPGAADPGDPDWDLFDPVTSAWSDANGDYEIRGLGDPGGPVDYYLDFESCGCLYGPEFYDNALDPFDATPVTVEWDTHTANIDAVLQSDAPALMSLPSISGDTDEVGNTLTASNGTWGHEPSLFYYQWERCDTAGDNCVPIVGAEDKTYVTTDDDAGARLRVIVTASNSIDDTDAESTASQRIAFPVSTSAPVITGSPIEGGSLSTTPGGWTGTPTFDYQWARCDATGAGCTPIGSATASTYSPVAADVGGKLQVTVTATAAGGSTTKRAWTDVPVNAAGSPESVTPPTITGLAYIGGTLSGDVGTWTGTPTSYTYQWARCDASGSGCTTIGGAEDPTYQTVTADIGGKLRLKVTAINALGSTFARAWSAPISGKPGPAASPVVSGSPFVGGTLSATTGTWTGPTPAITFQWARCDATGASCTDIGLADSSSYNAVLADVGGKLRVTVTATNGNGSTTRRAWTDTVISGRPSSVNAPVISGPAFVGGTLSTTDGTWNGSPASFAYQWARCDATGSGCTTISGADQSSYTPVAADVGGKLQVTVTATNADGSNTRRAWTNSVVSGAPLSLSAPVVSGTPLVGATLSTTNGTWTGSPAFTYVWARCDATGSGCTTIGGATSSTYVPVTDDIGGKLQVTVTATNADGATTRRAWTDAVIGGSPYPQTGPSITGTVKVGNTLTAVNGVWAGGAITYSYVWARCDSTGSTCTTIGSATGSTYDLVSADLGKKMQVTVTATNSYGATSRRAWTNGVVS